MADLLGFLAFLTFWALFFYVLSRLARRGRKRSAANQAWMKHGGSIKAPPGQL